MSSPVQLDRLKFRLCCFLVHPSKHVYFEFDTETHQACPGLSFSSSPSSFPVSQHQPAPAQHTALHLAPAVPHTQAGTGFQGTPAAQGTGVVAVQGTEVAAGLGIWAGCKQEVLAGHRRVHTAQSLPCHTCQYVVNWCAIMNALS